MAAQRISEKEFRTRRRDRRMVWVDAAAFLVGLVIVTASVGGVIFYEEETEPIEWVPFFVESPIYDERTCAGYAGGQGNKGEACTVPLSTKKQKEGEQLEYVLGVTQANVTQVEFTLRWFDEIPPTDGECGKYCGREWDYNEDSTAILNLTVITPWGEEFGAEDANEWENVTRGSGDEVPTGRVDVRVPVQDPPEVDDVFPFYSQEQALRAFNESYYNPDHRGIGDWTAVVTVVRQGNMNGTFPTEACAEAGLAEEDVPDGEENCDLYEEYELVFGPGQGLDDGGLPSLYQGVYGVYGEALLNDVKAVMPDELQYTSSYKNDGQAWTLSMKVRGFEAHAGVAEE